MCPGNNGSNCRGRRPRRGCSFVSMPPTSKRPAKTGGALASVQYFPVVSCNIKNFMQLNVGNGYGRSTVPSFVVLKCWAQRYAATNSLNMTGKSYVSPRNGHNRSLHWRIASFRCYSLVGAIHESPAAIAPSSSTVIRAAHISIASSLESADV